MWHKNWNVTLQVTIPLSVPRSSILLPSYYNIIIFYTKKRKENSNWPVLRACVKYLYLYVTHFSSSFFLTDKNKSQSWCFENSDQLRPPPSRRLSSHPQICPLDSWLRAEIDTLKFHSLTQQHKCIDSPSSLTLANNNF